MAKPTENIKNQQQEKTNKKNGGVSVYGYTVPYSDTFDLLRKALTIHFTIMNFKLGKEKLRMKYVDVLSFYLTYGYNDETKDMIIDSLGLNRGYLTNVNHYLTKMGFLHMDSHRIKDRRISNELLELKDYFLGQDSSLPRISMIRFNEDDRI